eukprot:g63.t1
MRKSFSTTRLFASQNDTSSDDEVEVEFTDDNVELKREKNAPKPQLVRALSLDVVDQTSANTAVNTLMSALVEAVKEENALRPLDPNDPNSRYVLKDEEQVNKMVKIVKEHGNAISSRGTVGETVLHQALVFMNTAPRVYFPLADFLIGESKQFCPSLVNDIYKLPKKCGRASPYHGECALHIAAINNELALFRKLIEFKADVNSPRACGNFFMPFPQTKLKMLKGLRASAPKWVRRLYIDDDSYCYFGETVLAFAACLGRVEMVKLCIENGADVLARDSLGNNVMHVLLLHDNKFNTGVVKKMFPLLLKAGASVHSPNANLQTPLLLAADLGNPSLFDVTLDCYRETLWTFANIGCYRYPLRELDSIHWSHCEQLYAVGTGAYMERYSNKEQKRKSQMLEMKEMDQNSNAKNHVNNTVTEGDSKKEGTAHTLGRKMAEIAVQTKMKSFSKNDFHTVLSLAISKRRLKLLRNPVLRLLIEHKWVAFARDMFFRRYAFMFWHILCVSFAVWTRPRSENLYILHDTGSDLWNGWHYTRFVAEIAVFCNVFVFIYWELDEIRRQGMGYIFDYNAVDNFLTLVHCVAVLVLATFKILLICGVEEASNLAESEGLLHSGEVLLTSLMAMTVWIMFIYTNRTVHAFGPLVIVIEKVALEEMSKFIFILACVTIGFAQAFYVVYASAGDAAEGMVYGESIAAGVFEAFLQSLDNGSMEFDWEKTPVSVYTRFLFIIYLVMTSLLLLNIIIAVFTKVLDDITENAEDVWYHSRAEVILSYESHESAYKKWEAYCKGLSCFTQSKDCSEETKDSLENCEYVLQQYNDLPPLDEEEK